ncbi:Isopentenyl-diphosphate delta-isomerase I [Fasciola gigantica]|uniref:isopentenyl-diphosphate Delta-isomerase n=1 Tax=Fasciola gigantica TaxID=46835 RepID=A0A504YMS9_FASGI|nr:Isopentenyl-diphosphate delta-isomerase I [Fasciola gigantica]
MRPFTSLFSKLPMRPITAVQNNAQNRYMDHEFCFLVDMEDQPIGTASKKFCHERKDNQRPPLHRAFSLFLYAPKNDPKGSSTNLSLLMQQRASSKLTYPNLWSNTCCSHPLSTVSGEDEQHDALGLRRASQRKILHELGIQPDRYLPLEHVHFLTRILYYAPNSDAADPRWAEHELDALLVSVLPDDPDRNPRSDWMRCNSDEVSATRWISRSDVDSLVRCDPPNPNSIHQWTLDSLTPWFRSLLTTGLLHRLWDWAEAYANLQSDFLRFQAENQRWDRARIHRLHCS